MKEKLLTTILEESFEGYIYNNFLVKKMIFKVFI